MKCIGIRIADSRYLLLLKTKMLYFPQSHFFHPIFDPYHKKCMENSYSTNVVCIILIIVALRAYIKINLWAIKSFSHKFLYEITCFFPATFLFFIESALILCNNNEKHVICYEVCGECCWARPAEYMEMDGFVI